MDIAWIPHHKHWRLNERHYGALQGLNKSETAAKHGEEQVLIWRRSYDVPPPPLEIDDERHPRFAPQYQHLPADALPCTESLKITVDRVSRYSFSTDGKYVAAVVKPAYDDVRALKLKKTAISKMPKDSLYVINLASGEMNKIARVKNFQLPAESEEWIAWLHEKPLKKAKKEKEDTAKEEEKEEPVVKGRKKRNKKKKKEEPKVEEKAPEEPKDPRAKSKGTELVLHNMKTGEQKRFSGVMEYRLTEEGNNLFFEYDKVDSLNQSGVHAFNTSTGTLTTLNEGMTDYKKITPDKSGNQVAFFATANTKDDDHKYFSLMHWNDGATNASIVADTTTAGVPENWMVSGNSRISFAESGKRVYFGTAPRPFEYGYEADTTLLKEDRPDVDIWSYNDPYIQPMQKLQAETQAKVQLQQSDMQFQVQKMQGEASIKSELMKLEFDLQMKLKGVEVEAMSKREDQRETAKAERISQANTEQSKLIQQRKNNLAPVNFESKEDSLDGFDLAEFEPR